MTDTFLTRIRELKFKQLLVFERTVALGSTYKAAQALHMSQPNVFKIIVQLETLLGVVLFERHSKGLVPTVFAEHLLDPVKVILSDARAMGEELAGLRSGERGRVVVGTLISASARLLPESIALLKARHPFVDIVVREATNDLLYPMLSVGELDVIVGRLPDNRAAGVDYHELYEEQLLIVTRAEHPLAQRTPLDLHALVSYPWIVPTLESPVRKRVDDFFERNGLAKPVNQIVSLSMLTNLGVLRHSDTVGALPGAAARPLIEAGSLHEMKIGEAIVFGAVGYSTRAGRRPTPAGRAFIDALKAVGAGIAESG